mgnify:CR=1 FL=1
MLSYHIVLGLTHSRRRLFDLQMGFTLVELLVVIAIIGTLATLVLLQLGTARGRARDAKRIADVNQLRSAAELFYEDNGGTYPADITVANLSKYLTQVPLDPLSGGVYGYATNPALPVKQSSFHVWTELEQRALGALGGDADINSSTWGGPENSRGGINGATETCANAVVTDNECIYDQGQQ